MTRVFCLGTVFWAWEWHMWALRLLNIHLQLWAPSLLFLIHGQAVNRANWNYVAVLRSVAWLLGPLRLRQSALKSVYRKSQKANYR